MSSHNQHATSKELAGFRVRALPSDQMSHVSRHLCECSSCNRAYRAIATAAPAVPEIATEADSLHLSYEQISDGLEAAPESPAWVLMERHILVCASCATEVRELRAFDSQLANPSPAEIAIPAAQALRPTIFDLLRDFFRAPQSPAFAGAALSLMAVGFFLVLANPAATEGGASMGAHTDLFQTYLAPRSITGVLLLLAGAGGLIYRFVRKTPKQ